MSIFVFTCLFICVYISPSVHLSLYLFFSPVCSSIRLCVCASACVSTFLSICPIIPIYLLVFLGANATAPTSPHQSSAISCEQAATCDSKIALFVFFFGVISSRPPRKGPQIIKIGERERERQNFRLSPHEGHTNTVSALPHHCCNPSLDFIAPAAPLPRLATYEGPGISRRQSKEIPGKAGVGIPEWGETY